MPGRVGPGASPVFPGFPGEDSGLPSVPWVCTCHAQDRVSPCWLKNSFGAEVVTCFTFGLDLNRELWTCICFQDGLEGRKCTEPGAT